MTVVSLALHNFRNFTKVEEIILPPAALLVAAAPNATGKTNFLEALVVLLRGKSWRAPHAQCVQWEKESFTLRGTIKHADQEAQLAVHYHAPSRRLRVEENGVPASPVTFYSHYPLILFLPEDTFMFSRGPAARRNFINRTLVSRPHYVAALVQYQRALQQRNSALKGAAHYQDIAAWTDILITHGHTVWQLREEFISYLQTHTNELYEQLSGEPASFTVTLHRPSGTEMSAEMFGRTFAQEQRYGHTLTGPHRDDMTVEIGGRPVENVLSRGQLRSLTSALKVASWRYIESITGETPLLLLDDVLSELDIDRQTALLSHLPKAQVVVTCTSVPEILFKQPNVHRLDIRSILAT